MVDSSKERSSDGNGRKNETRRAPFDTSDLQKLQYPRENDPPYRPFWVDEPRK